METPRDWTVMAASNPARLRLASHVQRVRPGVPLRASGQDDWEISPTGEDARWIAATNETGGNLVDVWKMGTFATHTPGVYKAGDTLAIDYIDDYGRLYLRPDPHGKIEAINTETIFMTVPLR